MSIKQNIEKRRLEELYSNFLDTKSSFEKSKLKLIEAQENLSTDPKSETELAKRNAVVSGYKYQLGKLVSLIEENSQYEIDADQDEIDEVNAIKLELTN